ncbi:MAG: hypothetical protein KDK70_36165 [Myxococcales bacterium]|nr:hypothetical protein [Myxococcales bacterium]
MKTTLLPLLLLSLVTAPLVACDMLIDKDDDLEVSDEGANVDDLEEDDEGEDDAADNHVQPEDSAGSGDRPDPDEVRAFAIRHGDLPEIDVGGGDSGGSGGGTSIDPDALLVVITNGAATCSNPFAADECGSRWSVSFTLPPELQAPGTYSLWDDLNGGFSVTGEPYPEGDCSWGGGSLEGKLELYEIDGTVVRGQIVDAPTWDFDANVAFDADTCG